MSSKYDRFGAYLSKLPETERQLTFSFEKFEEIVEFKLPASAYTYQAWWAFEQEPKTHPQKKVLQAAGWRVRTVDFTRKLVYFERY
jgi:hypothetical protein